MRILSVDTSCDETSAAVVVDDTVQSNVVSSQVDLHKKWGGVVPDIARRAHEQNIAPVINEALSRARCSEEDIDMFAATYGPGLAIALEIGVKETQARARTHGKPFAAVNHMEGHLLSSFAKNSKGNNPYAPNIKELPMIGLLVSGGHTELVHMKGNGDYTLLGETLDDAAGEALDKVAKMLDLGYPGGPIVSEFAKRGTPGKFNLPTPMERSGDLNFSYSGLKTAALYTLQDLEGNRVKNPIVDWAYDFCADFLESTIKSLVIKLEAAVDVLETNGILLGGGVMSNVVLRRRIRSSMKKHNIPVYQPYSPSLFTDNAAMIGVAAYFMAQRSDRMIVSGDAIDKIDRDPIARIGIQV